MRWDMRCWIVDDERMIWAIEIMDLRCDELDWIVELCELHVFDGNELVVLNGWLICGKPRKKRWDWKHMLYDEMRNWAMWNCTKWLILKKDAQKGKRLNWKRCPEREKIEMKKDAQMGKECDEKDEKWFTYY